MKKKDKTIKLTVETQELPADPDKNKARSVFTQFKFTYEDLKEFEISLKQKNKKKHLKDNKGRVKIYFDGFDLLINNLRTTTAYRTALIMIKHLDWDGTVSISQQEIGKKLNIKRQNINKAIKEILEPGPENKPLFVKIDTKKGTIAKYRINENLAWKGWIDKKPSMQKTASQCLN